LTNQRFIDTKKYMVKRKISVLGAGSWGLTLANLLFENGSEVKIWEFDKAQASLLRETRTFKFLPWLKIPLQIQITSNLGDATKDSDIMLFAVPSRVTRELTRKVHQVASDLPKIVVSAVKGLDIKSQHRMSEIIESEFTSDSSTPVVVISGPSHAEEVSRKIPTCIVSAGTDSSAAEAVRELLMNKYFRVYTTDDVIGVEFGGALKNVIAIAAGICDGLKLGDNTKAALASRGLAEMRRLGAALGARDETFFGLSGLGDLIVTCMSKYSRNRAFGEKIASGLSIEQAMNEIGMVVEGVSTCEAANAIAKREGVDMPITNKVYEILFHGKSSEGGITELMTRPAKSELETGRG
jgi:glycerol-3-phosphate dehydrogenase (NAD(P)+)